MSDWVEECADLWRFLSGGSVTQLLALLPDTDTLETEETACCIHLPSGRKLLCIPRGDRYLALHEAGHSLLTVGLGMRLAEAGVPTARRQLIRDEGIANRFRDAYLQGSGDPLFAAALAAEGE